jgi:hypothetical protein
MTPFPKQVREDVVLAVMRLAGFPESAEFPVDGVMDTYVTEEVHLHWHVSVDAVGAPVRFRRLP